MKIAKKAENSLLKSFNLLLISRRNEFCLLLITTHICVSVSMRDPEFERPDNAQSKGVYYVIVKQELKEHQTI